MMKNPTGSILINDLGIIEYKLQNETIELSEAKHVAT